MIISTSLNKNYLQLSVGITIFLRSPYVIAKRWYPKNTPKIPTPSSGKPSLPIPKGPNQNNTNKYIPPTISSKSNYNAPNNYGKYKPLQASNVDSILERPEVQVAMNKQKDIPNHCVVQVAPNPNAQAFCRVHKPITTSDILNKPIHEIMTLATKDTYYVSPTPHSVASFELTFHDSLLKILVHTIQNDFNVSPEINSSVMPIDTQQVPILDTLDKVIFTEYLNKNGIPYKTEISLTTTVDQITDQRLIENTRIRQLSKLSKAAAVSLVTLDGQKTSLGFDSSSETLTELGYAMFNKTFVQNSWEKVVFPGDIISNFGVTQAQLIVAHSDECFIKNSLLNHVLVTCGETSTHFYVFCYLTSKVSEYEISSEQFKKYQDIKLKKIELNSSLNKKAKIQYVAPLNNIMQIDKSKCNIILYGQSYINSLPLDAQYTLRQLVDRIKNNSIILFNHNLFSKQQMLHVLQSFDYIAGSKERSFPKTVSDLKNQISMKNSIIIKTK